MKAKIEVFTSKTCPHCKTALRFLKEYSQEHDVDIVHFRTEKASEEVMKYKIRSVPTILVSSPIHEQRIGFTGTPTKYEFDKAIGIVLGKEKPKKSIFKRIFGK